MENPCFQDSDQSMYESNLGIKYSAAVMPHQRRPHQLATLHHNHTNNSVITHLHSPTAPSLPSASNSNTIGHAHHPAASGHGLPATAHIHSGRIVGVPAALAGTVTSQRHHGVGYPDQNGMQTLFATAQPLYSCQAPHGHDHVYQCPGHRGDHPADHHSNTLNLMNHLEHQQQMAGGPHEIRHLDHCELRADHQQQQYVDRRDTNLECRGVVMPSEQHRQQCIGSEQRTEYHYGGSDYSSTEPIYAQPHLHPHDGVASSTPAHTPPLAYTNIRGSLRTSSVHHHGTPARFLVRTDSTGASTSSSTLPTVSALLSVDRPHGRPKGGHHSHEFSKTSTLSSGPSTPAKLKSSGVMGVWKSKYLRGAGRNKRATLILGMLVLLLLLVLGGLSAVLYLTIGGGLGAIGVESPQLVHLTEKGSNVVTVEFRITNHNYWPELSDQRSEAFQTLSISIEQKLDELFRNSVWSNEYNQSEVVSLTAGSIVVRALLHINNPDPLAANKFGSAFLRGLQEHHDQEWLGSFAVDIKSIRFAEILVDMAAISSTSAPPVTSTTAANRSSDVVRRIPAKANVGWGDWSSWSSCSPCAPQYDQIRTRQCRLDGGKGLLLSTIELCLATYNSRMRGSSGDMETRPCQCDDVTERENVKESDFDMNEELFKSNVKDDVYSSQLVVPTTTVKLQDTTRDELQEEEPHKNGLCELCAPGEVCVALVRDAYPTCRPAKKQSDPTGCGGLCVLDSEVCQALGHRAFQCHSASQCLDDEWRCADGLCIPQAKRCDGHLNCYDRSDEVMCECKDDQFHCGNRTSCLPITARCDGNVDCWDGLDEANCTDGIKDASHFSPSVIGATRAGTSVMNRTAIGLSSLSQRERDLLS